LTLVDFVVLRAGDRYGSQPTSQITPGRLF